MEITEIQTLAGSLSAEESKRAVHYQDVARWLMAARPNGDEKAASSQAGL